MWNGTTIRFDLADTEHGSELMFAHDGFSQANSAFRN